MDTQQSVISAAEVEHLDFSLPCLTCVTANSSDDLLALEIFWSEIGGIQAS